MGTARKHRSLAAVGMAVLLIAAVLFSCVSQVRAVVAAKVGFRAQKDLEKRAISIFDLSAEITPVLTKITAYYDWIDHHKSLR